MFVEHTLESAPQGSRRAMEATVQRLGHLPRAVAKLATSPHLLDGFLRLSAMFEQTTLEPVAREVVIMAVAARNGCEVCVAMHTGKLRALGADDALVAALCEARPVGDERLEAVRRFALLVLDTAGAVQDADLRAFLAHGYTRQHALEVVMGIGTYTMSTLANRLTRA
ncbi:carboxymuconolactone decarboxylase family protein [Streptomyces sp. HNM0663]|uniref:Carboxymuconolactone decarboxylase family protein n=1 Tax=Streptomyces chengmaiensis TaxID=3040919 RepID=A0ABT6HXL4_9ACTN|nr:carboxymuconolactone decarboxylase family protein [Streptomyces chengmaiensis]MDH2393033.1 carboxymuconolactone decarboxylase family protein [Streptomyces chengmaiensis]